MANKVLESTKLYIEVEVGTDKEGNPVYNKKNIGNLIANADPTKVNEIVTLISGILDKSTGYTYVTELSKVENN